jgi:hypothetical protein
MDIDQLAAVLLADHRLAALGFPRTDAIAKSGTLEARTMLLAADVCRRTAELVESVKRRVAAAEAALDANAAAFRELRAADLQYARPAGRA